MAAPVIVGKPLPVHPLYRLQAQARNFWQRSDVCRWDFAISSTQSGIIGATSSRDAKGYPVLPKHEREPDNRYQRRLNQAMPRRFVRQIVNRYNDHVCRHEIKRPDADPSSAYGLILADADGAGCSLKDLMRRALRQSQVDGAAYLLADVSQSEVYETEAQDEDAKKRPIMRLVVADRVVWWRDYEGSVVEAIITCEDAEGTPFAWWVNTETVCRVNVKKIEGTHEITVEGIGEEQPHEYEGCPLVRLVPECDEHSAPGDDSMASPIADCQKKILNIESWLYEELQGNTFTTPVILGASPSELQNANGSAVVVGPGMGLVIPNPVGGGSVSLDKMGSDPAQAASLRESLAYEIQQLYRVAGLSPGNPTEVGAPESGVAKAFQFNEIEARLAAMADAAQKAENAIMRRLSNLLGGYPGDAIWPSHFDAPDVASELDLTIRILTAPQMPAVLKSKAVANFASTAFALTPEEQTELDGQIDDMATTQVAVENSPFTSTRSAGETQPAVG